MLYTYTYNTKNVYLKNKILGLKLQKKNRFVTLRSLCLYPAALFSHISGNYWFVT